MKQLSCKYQKAKSPIKSARFVITFKEHKTNDDKQEDQVSRMCEDGQTKA